MNFKKMAKLSDRLLYIRKHFNFSQVDLAKKAGTTQQAIQQAEAGKAQNPRYLHKLARELDIPVDWLVLGQAVDIYIPQKKSKGKKHHLGEPDANILNVFYSMPPKDQELILALMKSRQEKEK